MPVKVANILQYFIESIALQANYVTVVEDRTISTKYFLPLLAKTGPSCSAVSAIAELLVITSFARTTIELLCFEMPDFNYSAKPVT